MNVFGTPKRISRCPAKTEYIPMNVQETPAKIEYTPMNVPGIPAKESDIGKHAIVPYFTQWCLDITLKGRRVIPAQSRSINIAAYAAKKGRKKKNLLYLALSKKRIFYGVEE